jgi:hypothetical protein
MNNDRATTPLSREDLVALLGIVSGFESSFVMDDAASVLASMKRRLIQDSEGKGRDGHTNAEDSVAYLRQLNAHIRGSLGEKPSPDTP